MQGQESLKKYPVNYWVDEETNDRLERFKMFWGGRSHIARQALLKELDRLEQERNNTPTGLKAS
jgi:hypothetical protein